MNRDSVTLVSMEYFALIENVRKLGVKYYPKGLPCRILKFGYFKGLVTRHNLVLFGSLFQMSVKFGRRVGYDQILKYHASIYPEI